MRLKGKVALITGGGSGIGKSTAGLFAKEGAAVVITGRRKEKLDEVVSTITRSGGHALAAPGSVTNDAEVRDAVELGVRTYGKIDILVNNAGNLIHSGWLHEMSDQAWTESLDVFLTGVFRTCRAVIPYMIKNQGGSIVNVSATASTFAIPGFYAHAYAASKAGVNILTRTIAIQYASHKIRCNAICPAGVDTSLLDALRADPKVWKSFNASYPLGRVGRPEEIAQAILYLASDEAAWTTGTIVTLDGGITAKE